MPGIQLHLQEKEVSCTASGGSRILERGVLLFAGPLPKAVHRGAERRSVRAKRGKFISPLFFSYQDGLSWHLRALHCKFQDCRTRGRHVLPFLPQISLTQRILLTCRVRGLVPKPFGFSQELQCNGS